MPDTQPSENRKQGAVRSNKVPALGPAQTKAKATHQAVGKDDCNETQPQGPRVAQPMRASNRGAHLSGSRGAHGPPYSS